MILVVSKKFQYSKKSQDELKKHGRTGVIPEYFICEASLPISQTNRITFNSSFL